MAERLPSEFLPISEAAKVLASTDVTSVPGSVAALAVFCARNPEQGAEFGRIIAEAKRRLQEFQDIVDADRRFVADPQSSSTPLQSTPQPVIESQERRRPSKLFDFLLYEGINQQQRLGHPVSQKDLFDLGCALDENTKRDSLTAKLARLKERGLMEWQRADELKLTPAGRDERHRLKRYLNAKDIEAAKTAFQEAWGIEVTIN